MDPWQAALEDVGPAGVDKGAGGKYLILPPGYQGRCRTASSRCRRRTIRAMPCCARSSRAAARPTSRRRWPMAGGSAVSAQPGGQSARDRLPRCDRHALRFHDPLRPALLPVARPLRAEEPWLDARQGDDRPAEIARHREGQAVQSRRDDKEILNTAAREARAWLD